VDEAERRRRPGQHPDLAVDHRVSVFGDIYPVRIPRYPDRPGKTKEMVDGRRLELPTSALRTPRSPN
jgi:hypothetical protein